MCGIAGAFDLVGRRDFPRERLLQMMAAIAHRGPDDEGVHLEPGLALGSRRLAIIDLIGGSQPIANETGDVWVSFEGEWYDHAERRDELIARQHRFRTRCDTEIWVHAYEDFGEQVFTKARGQFSVALWDRKERKVLLARDRFGIGPLFYAQHDGWLIWASEVKGILASGMIHAEPDRRGIDYTFNFFGQSNERTCFQGISQIAPGHCLRAKDGRVSARQYWDFDFPDYGEERRFPSAETATQELEQLLRVAVRRRLVGEVPIGCYLSGGLDSTMILGLCTQEAGVPVPSFTVGLDRAGPTDERGKAARSAQLFGSPNTTVNVTEADIVNAYPGLIAAAEAPVIDTSAACMMYLAQANRMAGNKIALTGEGADEALAGYLWLKAPTPSRLQERLNRPVEHLLRGVALSLLIGGSSAHRPGFRAMSGVRVAQQLSWEIIAQSREELYSNGMWQSLGDWSAYGELKIPVERMKQWHPLNRAIYVAYKTLLPGMLLAGKGDRPIRAASTEGRYPFLDEQVVDFCAELAPQYKVRWFTDKWLLRQVAAKIAPHQIGSRRKQMFRATMSRAFLRDSRPAWVDQLLSRESLNATGYFDPAKVQRAREIQKHKSRYSMHRFSLDFGLIGVLSTQLWHHIFCGGGLADLDSWRPASSISRSRLLANSSNAYPNAGELRSQEPGPRGGPAVCR